MQNLKEVLVFLAQAANASISSLADGKFSLSDLPKFSGAAAALIPALKNSNLIRGEWDNRTDEQLAECHQAVAEVFDVQSEEVEDWVEDAVDVVIKLADLIDDAGEVFKKVE